MPLGKLTHQGRLLHGDGAQNDPIQPTGKPFFSTLGAADPTP